MEIDWEKFKMYLSTKSSNKKHINNMVNYAKKFHYLLDLSPLEFALEMKKITQNKKTLKRHVLQALANFSKFLDLTKDTDIYYKRFKELREKANISWGEEKTPFILKEPINKQEIIEKIKNIKNKRLKATIIIHLLTGLRTGEVFYLIKNFEKLKKMEVDNGVIIELNFVRKTKKVFFTVLHKDALKFVKIAYKCEKSYWKNISQIGIQPYVFRRLFETLYSNLRSHEIDLLQGRMKSELILHYTRDINSIALRILKKQEEIMKEIE